jgi:hypothetical protein
MEQTYRIQLINNSFIDVQAKSPQDAVEQIVASVEVIVTNAVIELPSEEKPLRVFRIIYLDSSVQFVEAPSIKEIKDPIKWSLVGCVEPVTEYSN